MAHGYFSGQTTMHEYGYLGAAFVFANNVGGTLAFGWMGTNLTFSHADSFTAQTMPGQSPEPVFYRYGFGQTSGVVTSGTITEMSLGADVAGGFAYLTGLTLAAVNLNPVGIDFTSRTLLAIALAGDDVLELAPATNAPVNNYLSGFAGNDLMIGRQGWDYLDGGTGHDTLQGGQGPDELIGWTGQDSLYGNQGGDILRGFAGADQLFGGFGRDQLFGGTAADRLSGGAGNDSLAGSGQNYGGLTVDTLTGGLGDDAFMFNRLQDFGDVITDFGNVAGNNDFIRFCTNGSNMLGFPGSYTPLAANAFQTRTDNVAQDADDRFIFRTTDRTLWFDADGTGSGGASMVADLQTGAVVTAADILVW